MIYNKSTLQGHRRLLIFLDTIAPIIPLLKISFYLFLNFLILENFAIFL